MRCIALAQAWQNEGGIVVFLSHCESDKLRERIVKEGFDFVPIDHPHPHPSDLKETLASVSSFLRPPSSFSSSAPWLILDGYHFTPEYQKAIKDAGIRLLVIDDMNHLPYYHADIILNQNIHATDLKYNCDPDTKLLLGPKYVLLRREFLKYKDFKRQIPDKARKILVTMGGADPDNVTLKVIQALNLLGDPDLEVKVVIGPSNPHIDSLREAVLHSPFSVLLLHAIDNMADLMAWADVAITAGGSTCWELAYMGVPMIALILAENQHPVVTMLDKLSIAIGLGEHNALSSNAIFNSLPNLLLNFKKRLYMIERANEIVDGEGCDRVILKVTGKKIRLRRAIYKDMRIIWEWANDPDTRKSAFNTDPIPWDTH